MKRLLPQKETGDIFLFHIDEQKKDDKKNFCSSAKSCCSDDAPLEIQRRAILLQHLLKITTT